MSYSKLMRRLLKIIAIIIVLFLILFFVYFNNTALVDPRTVSFYKELKDSLRARGFSPELMVVSTRRLPIHNQILHSLYGAAKKSKHVEGQALDFLVFDVNRDGRSDGKDVDIVYNLLDKNIIRDRGGLGKYKTEGSFFYRQMIHIDCRGQKARW